MCVRQTHRPVENIDRAQFARMIPAILTTGQRMEIEVDTQTIFTCPLDRFKEVPEKNKEIIDIKNDLGSWVSEQNIRPCNFGEERLIIPGFNGPVR